MERSLRQFCKTGKKSDAFCVYYCFCEIFSVFGSGYDSTNKLLEVLSDHEYHSGELLTKHRDHYSHSAYVFALGLAIYAKDAAFRKLFREFYKAEKASDTSFLHWWGLAALFHDIGYPFQLAHEQIKTYVENMPGYDAATYPYVAYENMDRLLALNADVARDSRYADAHTVGELLAAGINYRLGYPVDILLSLLAERYRNQPHFMDHGYFSAVLLFNRLCAAGVALDEPIVDVLTAIALHNNLNRYDIKAATKTDIAVPAAKHPLAYLLILCDELQDWNRTAFGFISKKDPLAWKVELDVTDGRIDVCYVFDSYKVADSVSRAENGAAAAHSAVAPDAIVYEVVRENSNYKKKANGKFVNDILALVRGALELTVTTREERKDKSASVNSSSESFVNLCDFARAIHLGFQTAYDAPDFDALPLEFKLSNIEQAKSYAGKLEAINCFYSDKELDYQIVTRFVNRGESTSESEREDLNYLAREEHLRWVREKLESGWSYGTDYKTNKERNAKKIHKDIVPFDLLPEAERAKDELMIGNMVPLLYHYGHGVRIYSRSGCGKPMLNLACRASGFAVKNADAAKAQVKDILRGYDKKYNVTLRSTFATEFDLLVVECAIELGIAVKAVLAMPYEQHIAAFGAAAKKSGRKSTYEHELRLRHALAMTATCKVMPDATGHILEKCKRFITPSDDVQALRKAGSSFGLSDDDIHIINCGGKN